MSKLIEVLMTKKDELQAIITECGDNQVSARRAPASPPCHVATLPMPANLPRRSK